MPRIVVLGVVALVFFRIIDNLGDSIDSASTEDDRPSFDEPVLATGEVFQVLTADLWRGTVYGYVSASSAATEDPPGTCVTVLGAVTVDELGADLVSDGSRAPSVGAISGGEYVAGDSAPCDTTPFTQTGWSSIRDANITVGTFYAFYHTVYFPPGIDATIDALAVGTEADPALVLYSPDAYSEVVSAPPGEAGVSAALGRELQPVGSGASSEFDVSAEGVAISWQGAIAGMVEVEPAPGFDGRCVVVLGTLTGFRDEGPADAVQVPVSIIVDGREEQGVVSSCVTDEVRAAGYQDIGGLSPSLAVPVPFFKAVSLPAAVFGSIAPAVPEMIVVGSSFDPGAALFEATILDAIPAP